jgi:hypothetical protein
MGAEKKPKSAVATHGPYEIEVPDDAQISEQGIIVRADVEERGWSVTLDGHTGCFVPCLPVEQYGVTLREAIVPVVGKTLTLFGQWGRPIQGMAVDDEVIFYRTPEQAKEVHRRWVMDHEAQARRAFLIKKPQMDAEYEKLDPLFQARIDRFRAEKGDEFRADSEGYEVYCLLQGQQIAAWAEQNAPEGASPLDFLNDARGHHERGSSADFTAFNDFWTRLIEEKAITDDGTNNQFSAAVSMARALLQHRAGEEVKV